MKRDLLWLPQGTRTFDRIALFFCTRLEVKQTERRREQAREETARREEDLEQCRAELAEATEELDSLRHKFRDQLESFVSGKVKESRNHLSDVRVLPPDGISQQLHAALTRNVNHRILHGQRTSRVRKD